MTFYWGKNSLDCNQIPWFSFIFFIPFSLEGSLQSWLLSYNYLRKIPVSRLWTKISKEWALFVCVGQVRAKVEFHLNVTCLGPTGITHVWDWQEVCSYDTVCSSSKFIFEYHNIPRMLLESIPIKWKIPFTVHLGMVWCDINLSPQKRFSLLLCPAPTKSALRPWKLVCMQAAFSFLNAKEHDKSSILCLVYLPLYFSFHSATKSH